MSRVCGRVTARNAVVAVATAALMLPFMRAHAQEAPEPQVVASVQAKPPPAKAASKKATRRVVGVGDAFSLPNGETPWKRKPTLFLFSAPWCVSCHVTIPYLLYFIASGGTVRVDGREVLSRDLIDVRIVTVGETMSDARKDAAKYPGATGIAVTTSELYIREWVESVIQTFPTAILVDKNGVVQYTGTVNVIPSLTSRLYPEDFVLPAFMDALVKVSE